IVRSVHESTQVNKCALGRFMLSDVTGDYGGAYNHATSAHHRRNTDRKVEGMAVLVDASSLKSGDMLAAPHPGHDLGKLIWVIWRYQNRYRPPQCLLPFVPAYLFSALVPTHDDAVCISSNDGMVTGVH